MLVLAVVLAVVLVLGAVSWLCAWWRQLANCGAVDFGANMAAHALIPKLFLWLVELCLSA